jgi:hypothetical protein
MPNNFNHSEDQDTADRSSAGRNSNTERYDKLGNRIVTEPNKYSIENYKKRVSGASPDKRDSIGRRNPSGGTGEN